MRTVKVTTSTSDYRYQLGIGGDRAETFEKRECETVMGAKDVMMMRVAARPPRPETAPATRELSRVARSIADPVSATDAEMRGD